MKIKKEKVVMAITIGIACLTLMLVMFMQFKVVRETDITEIENMRESELRVELTNWREKYKELNARYEEVSKKVSEYQNEKESDDYCSMRFSCLYHRLCDNSYKHRKKRR